MKKQLSTALFFICGLLAVAKVYAQDECTFAANNMKKLYVSGYIHVQLIESKEAKVVFDAPPEIKRLIRVKVSKEKVSIYGKPTRLKRISYRMTKVKVYYKQLDKLKVGGGARLSTQEAIRTKDFELIAIEGSDIDLKLQTKDVRGRISTGTEVLLEGTTDTFAVKVKMGASLDAYAFKTNICDIRTGMGASAYVFAREAIRMSAGMGSTIKYRGSPKKVLRAFSWMGSDIGKN